MWQHGLMAQTQQIISIINIPAVFVFGYFLTSLVITKREFVSSIIILLGIIVGIIPSFINKASSDHPPWYNSWYFIITFLASATLQSLEYVYQKRVFQIL